VRSEPYGTWIRVKIGHDWVATARIACEHDEEVLVKADTRTPFVIFSQPIRYVVPLFQRPYV